MMEGGGRVVRWKDEVKMENLDQFVLDPAPQVQTVKDKGNLFESGNLF